MIYQGPVLLPWIFVGFFGLLAAREMPLFGRLVLVALGPIGLLIGLADRILPIPTHNLRGGGREMSESPISIVCQQAQDEGLWFVAKTAPEAYLQSELRKLHLAVEDEAAAVERRQTTKVNCISCNDCTRVCASDIFKERYAEQPKETPHG